MILASDPSWPTIVLGRNTHKKKQHRLIQLDIQKTQPWHPRPRSYKLVVTRRHSGVNQGNVAWCQESEDEVQTKEATEEQNNRGKVTNGSK
jgi:hypothetical protein